MSYVKLLKCLGIKKNLDHYSIMATIRNANIQIKVTVPKATIKVLTALLTISKNFVDNVFVCIILSPLYLKLSSVKP